MNEIKGLEKIKALCDDRKLTCSKTCCWFSEKEKVQKVPATPPSPLPTRSLQPFPTRPCRPFCKSAKKHFKFFNKKYFSTKKYFSWLDNHLFANDHPPYPSPTVQSCNSLQKRELCFTMENINDGPNTSKQLELSKLTSSSSKRDSTQAHTQNHLKNLESSFTTEWTENPCSSVR